MSNSIEIELEREFLHPEYPSHTIISLTFEISVIYERADPSVGIMSGGYYSDNLEIKEAVLLDENEEQNTVDIDVNIVEYLFPEDVWNEIIEFAEDKATTEASELCDEYDPY
jgi:hypothetical protein